MKYEFSILPLPTKHYLTTIRSKRKKLPASYHKYKDRDMGKRIAHFIYGILGFGMAIAISYFTMQSTNDFYRLSKHGRHTVGTVIASRIYSSRRSTIYYNTISYNGHTHDFSLDKTYPYGTTFHILYLPNDPTTACLGKNRLSFFEILLQSAGWFGIIMVPIIIISLIIAGISNIRQTFAKEKSQTPDEETPRPVERSITCPFCSTRLFANIQHFNKPVRCPDCESTFVITREEIN